MKIKEGVLKVTSAAPCPLKGVCNYLIYRKSPLGDLGANNKRVPFETPSIY